MGTRSDIIVHRADDKWARIYCHWNGSIKHNGRILFEHYASQEKADALVALGDLSSLGEEIGKKHDFDWRAKFVNSKTSYGDKLTPRQKAEMNRLDKMCNAYGRDRGETDVDARVFDTLVEAWPGNNCGTEFTYVFDEGEWYVGDPDEGSQTLVKLGDVLAGKADAPKTAIKAFGHNFVIGRRR